MPGGDERDEVTADDATVGPEAVGRNPSEGERRLWLQARAAAEHAYAPYSGLRVGAAVAASDGSTYSGVNVENASYPAGLCAERAALAGAVGAGQRRLVAVAVARVDGGPIVPCGLCLQALAEFGELVVVVTAPGDPAGSPPAPRAVALRELLRTPFGIDGDHRGPAVARGEEAT